MKNRVNWTLSNEARENAELLAQERGTSMSEAAESALAEAVVRYRLRRPAGLQTVDVEFDRATLSDAARRMLEIAREQGVIVGANSVTIWDNDELGLDDTLRVQVRSLISYEERSRRFGIAGLDMAHVERDAEGKPTWRVGEAGSPIPSEMYLTGLRQFYGDALDTARVWEVPREIVRAVRSGKLAGNAAIERIAAEFWAWCEKGAFEPVQ